MTDQAAEESAHPFVTDSTALIAMLTAASFTIGDKYLSSYYSVFGLSLRSLDLPTSEVLLSSAISFLALVLSLALVRPLLWLSVRYLLVPSGPSPEAPMVLHRKRFKLSLAAALTVILGAIAVFALWGLWETIPSMMLLIAALSPHNPIPFWDRRAAPIRALLVFIALMLLANCYGRVHAQRDSERTEDLRIIRLYTTDSLQWSYSAKPMRLLLHRNAYWYVAEPGQTETHVIPDSAVLRAEQLKQD